MLSLIPKIVYLLLVPESVQKRFIKIARQINTANAPGSQAYPLFLGILKSYNNDVYEG